MGKGLYSVLDVKRYHEKEAAILVAQQKAEIERLCVQMSQLQQYKEENMRNIVAATGKSIAAHKDQQMFMGKVEQAIRETRHMIDTARLELNRRNREWQGIRNSVKAIDYIVEQRNRKSMLKSERIEQKDVDEMANRTSDL